jgi:hypothetical protein
VGKVCVTCCRICRKNPCAFKRRRNDAALEFPPREVAKAKSLARSKGARRGWEHRSEADEAVAVNLDAHELPLWDKTKRRFKGTPEERLRAFRQMEHDDSRLVPEAIEAESDAKLRRMIRQHEAVRAVLVPCAKPYRVRTKELCAMGNPKKLKAARRKKNGAPFGESNAQRSRRLSDERARKRAEKRSRATKRGDATRKRRRRANPSETAVGVRLFKRLHWDLPPASQKPVDLHVSSLKGPYAVLGVLREIGYETEKGERKKFLWEHEFSGDRTRLVVNGLGELLIAKTSKTGGYRVTERGIVG